MNEALRARVLDAFAAEYGGPPTRLFAAPGRVNLIGEHTDYNDGFVLPCAIARETLVAAQPRGDGRIAVLAADLDERDDFSLDVPIGTSGKGWADYLRGVAAILLDEGVALRGARLAIAGDVPQGAGLSSSASLEVAAALALTSPVGAPPDPTRLARIARRAENEFVGVACGIMDQLIATRAVAGHALLIDCRSLETRPVALPAGAAVLIADSGVRHAHAGGAYNDRRAQCAEAARRCGVSALRALSPEMLERHRPALGDLLYRRARHVVGENARVLAAADALAAGDLAAMGGLMAASHAAMRGDFEITVPAVDRLADRLNAALAGQGGARMTGGGFGGCVVALGPSVAIETLGEELRREGIAAFTSTAAGAAREIR